jgi:hypothetical protein
VTEAPRANRVWGVVTAHAGALGVAVSLRCLCQAAAAGLPVSGVAVSVRIGRVVSEVLCAIGGLRRELEELQLTVGETPHSAAVGMSMTGDLCGAKTRCRVCDLVFVCGWLGSPPVLVDQSAEYSVASDGALREITVAGS